MSCVEDLAAFACRSSYDDLSETTRKQLKIRILDAIGCAIGALEAGPIQIIRRYLTDIGPSSSFCSLIGEAASTPESAALYNGALVRHLNFNDAYVAEGENCHPSDNLAPILAGAEYADRTGRDLMTALAVAYQIQCRLSDVAPVRDKGFDHTTHGSYSVSAGLSRIFQLDERRTAAGIAISGTAFNALGVMRTGQLSQWKGLAFPNTAACCMRVVFLAMHDITGPLEVLEGEKGFMDAISGVFDIDWLREDLDRVKRTIIKRYDADVHSQTAIQGVLDLQERHQFDGSAVERIDIETSDAAYNAVGGGEDGDRKALVSTREQADQSLPYAIAAVLLDGDVMPAQYTAERIQRDDVQNLLRRVFVKSTPAYSRRFPEELPCRIEVTLRNGEALVRESRDCPGFLSHPMSWEMAADKFDRLASSYTTNAERKAITDAVSNFENTSIRDFMQLLACVHIPREVTSD